MAHTCDEWEETMQREERSLKSCGEVSGHHIVLQS